MKKKQSEVAALYYLFKKLLRAMKITLFLLLVFFIQVNAKTYSQQKKISLKYDNVELAKVMKAIERQTDLYFFFNDRVLNTGRKVENSTLERVLEELFYDSYSWEVVNRMIVLKPCEKSVVQEQQEKKVFKVTGVVVDVKKQPLPGVTVRLVGTSLGTATDENGKFEITLPVTEGELEFSFVGYKAERKVLKQTNPMPMEVVLTEEVTEMPLCFSISIQSDTAARAPFLPFTMPACWMAPPYKSSFSVSVVLPASGCEMIANVRRLSICSIKFSTKILQTRYPC